MMLLELLYRHLVVILTFVSAAATAWFYGGMRQWEIVDHLPWFLGLTLEALLFFPQKRPYEDILQARARVWRNLLHDPVFYLVLAFVGLLAVPMFNHGLCPNCDYEAIDAGADPSPFLPCLPFCVSVDDHVAAFTWFVPAFIVMLAIRHAMVREGRRVFMEMLIWNAVLLAIFGFIELSTGAKFIFWEKPEHPVYFFATFGYPNAAGAYLTMAFAFSIGLWRYHVKETYLHQDKCLKLRINGRFNYILRAHYMLIAIVILLVAVLYTWSRAAILFVILLSIGGLIYALIEVLSRNIARVMRFKTITISAVAILVIGIGIAIFAPKSITVEVKTANLTAIADRLTGKTAWHVPAALAIFMEHPFFGVGCWGYKHLCIPYVPESERKGFGLWYSSGEANVHNDYLQFLCEHGIVSVLILAAMVLCMFWPIARAWNRLYRAALFARPNEAPPKPKAIFALPAGTFWIFAGNICFCIHAFGDCPMRSAATLTIFFASLAAADGFMPHYDEEEMS